MLLYKVFIQKAQIITMMQQADPTWNPHEKIEFFKLCVGTTLSQMGQITSSMEKLELLLLETTLGNIKAHYTSPYYVFLLYLVGSLVTLIAY